MTQGTFWKKSGLLLKGIGINLSSHPLFRSLFISIQTFNSKELTEITTPDFYDYIVIDEFHHAAAPSYQELLDYYRPKVLLGLTATPERADGRSIFSYFNGRIAAEIRLWEAIERKLLSPFHYFGVTDNVDLSQVRWVGGKYDEGEIENLFVFEQAVAVKRVGNIINALERYCLDRSDITGIGFCVTSDFGWHLGNTRKIRGAISGKVYSIYLRRTWTCFS